MVAPRTELRAVRYPVYKWNMLRRLCCAFLVLTAACGFNGAPVKDLTGDEDMSLYKLQAMRGMRDGDHLSVQAMLSDSSSVLSVDFRFVVGSPTKLESGKWHWTGTNRMSIGDVSARSVTFLGGQDGPPSIGGSFDLLGPEGTPRYRLNIPVTVVKRY